MLFELPSGPLRFNVGEGFEHDKALLRFEPAMPSRR